MIIRRVRGVLSLISIPSTPVTVVSLLLGYVSITGSILTLDIISLIIIGAMGHWAFYGINDITDIEWDIRQRRTDKPLVRGDISIIGASIVCTVLGISSIIYSFYIFPRVSFFFWIAACLLGLAYDVNSKTDIYSGVYMGLWGFSIIYVGAFYAGGANGTTFILSLFLGVHMFWMTIMGNLKDVGQGEVSIPERFDCRIEDELGYKYLWTSIRFNMLAMIIVASQIILLLLLPIGDGAQDSDVIFIYISVVFGLQIWRSFTEVIYQPGFNDLEMKKDIALFEIVTVGSILVVSISFIDWQSAVLMFIGSVVWGLVWQTVLYGHPLRFP